MEMPSSDSVGSGKSIKQKLTILLLLIGTLPVLVIGIMAYLTNRATTIGQASEQLQSILTKQNEKLVATLKEFNATTLSLAGSKEVIATALSPASKAESLGPLENDLKSLPEVTGLSLVDANDVELLTLGEAGPEIIAQLSGVKPSDEPESSIVQGRRNGLVQVAVTARVFEAASPSRTLGYLHVSFRVNELTSTLQDYTGLGDSGETLVAQLDQEGQYVSIFPLRFNSGATLVTNFDFLGLGADPNKVLQTRDYRSTEVFATSQAIEGTNWAIATKIDVGEVLDPVNQFRNLITAMILSIIPIMALIAFYVSRSFANPVSSITRVARSIGHGDLWARTDVNRNDEIGLLAKNINGMGESLAQYVTSIEDQRNRLNIILNSTSESILAVDSKGRIITANQAAAKLSGSGGSLVGSKVDDVFMFNREGQQFYIDYSRLDPKLYNDVQFVDQKGVRHDLRLMVAPVNSEHRKEVVQTIITIYDETKDRELETMRVDFVSMAAHELRTPLAAIRGYLELMTFKANEGNLDEMNNYIRQAHKSSRELGGLINNLLDVTRIERGTLNFTWDRVDLAADLKQAVLDSQFGVRDKKISLRYIGPASQCFVLADEIALMEVVNNLIGNAIKYTQAQGRVEVELKTGNRNYVVSVRDNGVGVPEASQHKLFTKFFRAETGLATGASGTGLGLYIVKSIVERHGGTVGFKSKEGVGSTFVFSIPKYRNPALVSAQQSKAVGQAEHGGHSGWVTKNTTR